jgi:nitroreductase
VTGTLSTEAVAEAIRERRSVRAYTDQPVPEELLRTVLEQSLQAPSGGNLQPWRIRAYTGPALERLKGVLAEAGQSGTRDEPSHPVYPESLWDPYRSRRFENGEDLYRSISIPREDKPARLRQLAKNFRFFDAPVGLFFVIDRRMGHAQWLDLGILVQTVMLLATAHGLATCPQAAWASWSTTLAEHLELGEHEKVALGMALGYEDPSHTINQWRTPRQAFDEGVRIHSE